MNDLFQYTTDDFLSGDHNILVLGIGNYLMGDEGVGVQFIKNIDATLFPDGITFMDGGTGGFTLIPYIESYKTVIFVDATMDGNPDGTVRLLRPKFAKDFPVSLSGHNFGLKDMLEILTMVEKMPDIYLFTISISQMEPMQLELSPAVAAAIPKVTREILNLVENLKTVKVG